MSILMLCLFLLFFFCHRDVHAVCLWDDKGPAKIHQALKEDILDFIKQAQAVRKIMFLLLLFGCLWSNKEPCEINSQHHCVFAVIIMANMEDSTCGDCIQWKDGGNWRYTCGGYWLFRELCSKQLPKNCGYNDKEISSCINVQWLLQHCDPTAPDSSSLSVSSSCKKLAIWSFSSPSRPDNVQPAEKTNWENCAAGLGYEHILICFFYCHGSSHKYSVMRVNYGAQISKDFRGEEHSH